MNTYKTFDVLIVPFPFTDTTKTKNRPAIVLSSKNNFNSKINHTVLAMITSLKKIRWPLDIIIKDLKHSGLLNKSVIRFKLFTIDNRLIKRKIGELSKIDQTNLLKNYSLLMNDLVK